jgi:hypothetical protein
MIQTNKLVVLAPFVLHLLELQARCRLLSLTCFVVLLVLRSELPSRI